MAYSSLIFGTTHQACSVSFSPRSNPLALGVEEELIRLKASQATTSSSSPSFICQNLAALKNLYSHVDDLIQLPLNQGDKRTNEVIDGLLVVLDLFESTRDLLLQTEQNVQDFQSAIRRSRADDSCLAMDVARYRDSKKKVISKCLGELKRMHNKRVLSSLQTKDQQVVDIISILGQIEVLSISMFGSMLSFIAGPKAQSESLLSKLMHRKRVGCNIENQAELEGFQSSIEDLEDRSNGLFKCLINTRVSLLNSLNQ